MLDPLKAEAAVLGACLLSETAADRSVARLTRDDFYRNAHGLLFDTIARLRKAGRPVDTATVTEVMARQDRLDELGGAVALHDLTVACPSPSNIDAYADMVADHSRRRDLAAFSAQLAQGAQDGSRSLPSLLADARERLESVRPVGGRLAVYRDDELDRLPPVEWLIGGLVQHQGLNLVYGPWKQGKTFVVLDMAMHLLAGTDWHGREVRQASSVVYVAAEGAPGMRDRRKAWRTHHRTHPQGFTLVGSPVSLLDPTDVGELDTLVGESDADLLVIDTWARCIGGDENSNHDAGEAVRALDRIRDRHGCAVLVVHHSGHAEADRGRGASALPAAADSQVRVTMSASGMLTVAHQFAKEARPSPLLAFELTSAGPSAVPTLVKREGKSDDDLCQQLRTRLRSTPATVVELDRIVDGRHDLVERVLDEGEFGPVDPLERPAKWASKVKV